MDRVSCCLELRPPGERAAKGRLRPPRRSLTVGFLNKERSPHRYDAVRRYACTWKSSTDAGSERDAGSHVILLILCTCIARI
jgi:hypothetical protein